MQTKNAFSRIFPDKTTLLFFFDRFSAQCVPLQSYIGAAMVEKQTSFKRLHQSS
jgi:hypothetical protein